MVEEESELEMECDVELHSVKVEQPNGSFPVRYYVKIQLPVDVYQRLLDMSEGDDKCQVKVGFGKDTAVLKAELYIEQKK